MFYNHESENFVKWHFHVLPILSKIQTFFFFFFKYVFKFFSTLFKLKLCKIKKIIIIIGRPMLLLLWSTTIQSKWISYLLSHYDIILTTHYPLIKINYFLPTVSLKAQYQTNMYQTNINPLPQSHRNFEDAIISTILTVVI